MEAQTEYELALQAARGGAPRSRIVRHLLRAVREVREFPCVGPVVV